jgi:glutaredoxin
MAKVKLLVLDGCSRCKALRNKLDYLKTSFNYINCDDDPEMCDYVEQLSGVNTYPMAVILDINDQVKEIVYFAEDYNMVGKKHKLVDGVSAYGVYSIDQLVEYVIKS